MYIYIVLPPLSVIMISLFCRRYLLPSNDPTTGREDNPIYCIHGSNGYCGSGGTGIPHNHGSVENV